MFRQPGPPTHDQQMTHLADTLSLTVPLHIAVLRRRLSELPRHLTREGVLTAVLKRCNHSIDGPGMQHILYPSPNAQSRREARESGLALSEGVAAAALLDPDGVEVLGRHFCAAAHPECPARERTC